MPYHKKETEHDFLFVKKMKPPKKKISISKKLHKLAAKAYREKMLDKKGGHWILEGKKTREVGLFEWAEWLERKNKDGGRHDRHIASTKVKNLEVSTVFLGLDHSFGGKQPLLFETMIFGLEEDNQQDRYETYDQAIEGHWKHVGRAILRIIMGEWQD